METLYSINNGNRLEKRNNTILITSEKERRFVPIEQVDKLVIQGNAVISTPLMGELAYRKIPIYYYSYGGVYRGVFMPAEKNMGKVRMFQYKTYFDEERRLSLAKQILQCASKNKATILKRYFHKYEKEGMKEIIDGIEKNIKAMMNCDSIDSLRGYEGTITRLYYSAFPKIFKNFTFDGRNRRPPEDEINCLISYGNSRLYDDIGNVIYEVGLDHFLGFVHEMENSKPALVLDISEVFKQPIIDSIIFELVNNNVFTEKHFNKKEKFCFLNNFGKLLFLRKYEDKMNKTFLYRKIAEYSSYRNSIKIELYKLVKYLFGETDKFDGFRIY